MFDDKSIVIFSSRDRIRQQIIEYMSEYLELEGLDLSKTSYLSYMINIISALTANLLYYSSSIYREFFLTKAVQKESILNLSSMIGYNPPYAEPSQCSILVSIPLTFSFANESRTVSFKINKDEFKYYAGDITFIQDNTIHVDIFQITDSYNEITSLSAIVREETETSGLKQIKSEIRTDSNTGLKTLYFITRATQIERQSFEYQIPSQQPYEFYSIKVDFSGQIATVNLLTTSSNNSSIVNQEWTKYDSLFLIPYNERGYAFRRIESGGQIFFGNNVVGLQPDANSTCLINLNITQGAKGNVISGSINRTDRLYIEDPLPLEQQVGGRKSVIRPINISVINTEPAQGGKDAPTIDEIRLNAIENLRSMNRLVSKLDYDGVDKIIPELPIYHVTHIIKRSDIKTNEISLFTDLIFNDTIVPTRCSKWILDETSNVDLIIYTKDTININGSEYYSLFNFHINPDYKLCNYFYLAEDIERPVTVSNIYNINSQGESVTIAETLILPKYSYFVTKVFDESGIRIPPDEQQLEITLDYDIVQPGDYSNLCCTLIFDWDGSVHQMVLETINIGTPDERNVFKTSILLNTIPEGEKTYYFNLYFLIERGTDPITHDPLYVPIKYADTQVKVIIKQNLNECMYSDVEVFGNYPSRTINVYNVPVIKKSYYDGIDKNSFDLLVYDKILSFDVTKYRMLTDFINLKFSDTTGALTNMRLNKTTKRSVLDLNPISIPDNPNGGDRYIVTSSDHNPWDVYPWYKKSPFITEYIANNNVWIFEKLSVNDFIYITSLGTKMLFNGTDIVDVIKQIPLQLHVVVWKSNNLSVTEGGLVNLVKTKIVERIYKNFGFDKTLYISEITDAIQGINGVQHCIVLKPEHDIYFDFNIYNDLTQQELLEYAPQLVYTNTSEILVEVR